MVPERLGDERDEVALEEEGRCGKDASDGGESGGYEEVGEMAGGGVRESVGWVIKEEVGECYDEKPRDVVGEDDTCHPPQAEGGADGRAGLRGSVASTCRAHAAKAAPAGAEEVEGNACEETEGVGNSSEDKLERRLAGGYVRGDGQPKDGSRQRAGCCEGAASRVERADANA